jgi:hypothetical protein
MKSDLATDIINAREKLHGQSGNWRDLYQQVADRVWPQMADFNVKRFPGEKRGEKMFDSTAALALERGAAAFYSLMIPDNQYWHGLSLSNPELMEIQSVRLWLEEIRKRMFAVRRSPKASFSSQGQECIRSLLAFGTMAMFTEDMPGRGIRYKSIHLSELEFTENSDGIVDTAYRHFEFTARQAVEEFGIDKLPQKIKDAYEKGDEISKFEFIHYVAPNSDRKRGQLGPEGMAYKSCYVSCEGKIVVSEGGYRRFPYHIGRYATNPRETRGRGPAIVLLPDIKLLNEQEKTTLRAGHLAVDPPLLLFEDGALQGFQMRPRALNFGGVDEQGRQLVTPLQTGANLPWAFEMLEARRRLINEGFWLTLFQILVENPQMTATEAMLRAQEKGQLLSPPLGRQQTEWLGPMIRREIDILTEQDAIPAPPEEILEAFPIEWDPETGFGEIDLAEVLDIEYTSPLSRLIRSEDSVAILRTFEQLTPMAQIDPTVYDVFDTDKLPRELADINGVPAKVLRSEKDVEALREGRKQQQELQNTLAAAPVAASAAKDLASAASMVGSSPAPLPL